MEPSSIALIAAYRAAVVRAVDVLKASGIPQKTRALSGIPNIGALNPGGTYRKHGYGCTLEMPAGEVDFDFGSCGEVDAFDASQLWRFAYTRPEAFGIMNEERIRESLEPAHESEAFRSVDSVVVERKP